MWGKLIDLKGQQINLLLATGDSHPWWGPYEVVAIHHDASSSQHPNRALLEVRGKNTYFINVDHIVAIRPVSETETVGE